ncbi:TonB-dependent receptor SusC [Polaribacter huanghezhanensis]|uniref:DUF5686 family protein n=1 Tax=Polaribacter huanghezhanensis TaxID=1354726 RepID=UPI002647C631|nr:DUF5686 family protein [Polaribacter huanghezhanensis]WKD85919.1 TonB-dependent receptor SusC [Polaribacter huanghezhanensis]
MKILVPILFLLTCFVSNAQLKISGQIVNVNNEPLPYINVYFKNTTNGTVTGFDGSFQLTSSKKRGRIEISCVGYETLSLKFSTKKTSFKIILKEASNVLDEIVIVSKPKKRLKKKENPAYRILKEVWSRKKKNGLKLVKSYQYRKLQTTEVGLNNLDSLFLKTIFKKEYKEVLKELPPNDDGINYYIPLFLSETVKNIYGNNILNIEREDIEAEKNDGVNKDGFVFERMSNTFNDIDIHKNNIEILKKSFVSPISTTGFETYDYVLHDSIIVNNKKTYAIYFFPRRDGDLAFEGFLWVADKNFSITKIKMKINKDINLNFVRRLSFEKEFIIKNDSIYLSKKDVYTGDFTLTDKSDDNKGLTIKKTSSYSNYIFDQELSDNFYSEKIIRYKPKQFHQNKIYWDSVSKSTEKKNTYKLIHSVKNQKKIKQISSVLNTFSTGYFSLGSNLQFGQYWNTIVKNSVEGLKIKLGYRTFKTTDDRFRVSGFVGYGTKDKRYKFGTEIKYLVSYKPRIGVGISYLKDIEQLGGKLLTTNGLNANVFDPNALFSRGDNYFLSDVNRTAIKFDIELKKNLHFGISAAHNVIKSASPTYFSVDYLDDKNNIQSEVTDVSTDIYIAYTPGRFEYGFGIEQKMGRNLFPSLVVNYHRGYKGFLNGDFNYDKIQFKYSQPILLGKIGLMIATVDGGKTFGKVPITLLSPIPANQTYWLTKNTFSLMNYYDFVTDTYISGHFEQHFNGFILNRIPLIKHLKLRSLITFKTVYGTISDENIAINKSNITYAAPTDKLYYEYGFGLENIGYKDIRPLRVDFIWRGKHTSVNGLPSPKFAVRIGIKVGF